MELEELEDALVVSAASSLVAASGQVPHVLKETMARCGGSAIFVAHERFGDDAVQGDVTRPGTPSPLLSIVYLPKVCHENVGNELLFDRASVQG